MDTGIKKADRERIAALVGEISEESVLDTLLLEEIMDLTRRTGLEVILLLDAGGRVLHADFGTNDRANSIVPKDQLRYQGIRNFTIIHTHPKGSPRLSEPDLSCAREQRPIAMIAVGVGEDHLKGFGVAIPEVGDEGLVYTPYLIHSLKDLNRLTLRANRNQVNSKLKSLQVHDPEHENRPERALLIGVDTQDGNIEFDASMEELKSLAKTAGAEVIDFLSQKRARPETAGYLGKGKLSDLSLVVQNEDIDVIIANDDLTPVQMQTLEEISGVKVIDRTQLILDIFASHAKTAEGRLQVEMAQQRYRLTKIRGLGLVLSRTGGGIGTRGPGEKKLETDRRTIARQLWELEKRFEKMNQSYQTETARRNRTGQKRVALAGYTNAGKSSLFNLLTGSDVVEKNALFVTLDSTVRKVKDEAYLLSDTVGFIDKLPHELIKAFTTTLAEARDADVLLHVVDAADAHHAEHEVIVEEVLRQIGCLQDSEQRYLTVYNKADLLDPDAREQLEAKAKREGNLVISVREEEGIDALKDAIHEALSGALSEITLVIPYADGKALSLAHSCAVEAESEYLENGTKLVIKVREDDFPEALKAFRVEG